MTLQTKWYGHTIDINKAANQAQQFLKDQKHKTNNKHHESIPMVPRETQLGPSSRFHGNLSCHATSYIMLTHVNHMFQDNHIYQF